VSPGTEDEKKESGLIDEQLERNFGWKEKEGESRMHRRSDSELEESTPESTETLAGVHSSASKTS